jgi:membrane-associated phospholipid phosphatase
LKILIIILIFSIPLFPQADQPSLFNNFKSDLSTSAEGAGHVISSPLRWQSEDWLNFSAVIGGAAAISIFEKDIRKFIFNNKSSGFNTLADLGEIYGEPLMVVLLTGSLYSTGLILNDDWLRETSVILTAAILPSGIIQTTSKIIAGRARPYLNLENYYFEPFRQEEDFYSFVSGHTMVAVSTSWILAKRINNNLAKGMFYTAGIISAYSRLYHDEHWMSDVLLGGTLGILSANSVINWLENKKEKKQNSDYTWQFFPQHNRLTFIINW